MSALDRQLHAIERERERTIADRAATHVQRMIDIQAEAYPSHWTAAERRASASAELFGRIEA